MAQPQVKLSEIARHFGVSVATVSNALSGKGRMSEALARRIRSKAAELGYRPSAAGRALRTGRSDVLGLVLPDISNPLYPRFAQELERAATGAGYGLFITNSRDEIATQERALNQLIGRGVDGLIIVPRRGTRIPDVPCPIAVIDSPTNPLNTVSADHADGGRQIARHLLDLGHRHLLILGEDPASAVQKARVSGILDACPTDIRTATVWVVDIEARAGKGSALGLAEWLTRGVTAIACTSDTLALRALTELQAAGIAIPDQASLSGFDDLPWASFISPPLTTLKINLERIADLALDALIAAIDRREPGDSTPCPPVTAREGAVPMHLAIRGSTAPPPSTTPNSHPRRTFPQ